MARTLRILSLNLLALLFFVFAFIQFQQRLLRYRAEELNADVVYLREHPGTWDDMQRIQKRWGSFAHYDGVCNPQHCNYTIRLYSTVDRIVLWVGGLSYPVARLCSFLGGRGADVFVRFRLTNNRIWGSEIDVESDVMTAQDQGNYGYALMAEVIWGPRLFNVHRHLPITSQDAQRGYLIGRPGGCEGCIERWISLTPFTAKADRDRIAEIDFDCITRLRACRNIADLLPNAEKQEEADAKLPQPSDPYERYGDPYCKTSLRLRAIDADHVLSVRILDPRRVVIKNQTGLEHVVAATVAEKIKNARLYRPLESVYIAGEWWLSPKPPLPGWHQPWPIPAGSYFVLFNDEIDSVGIRQNVISPDPCAIVPDTSASRAEIVQGVTDDPSIGEDYLNYH